MKKKLSCTGLALIVFSILFLGSIVMAILWSNNRVSGDYPLGNNFSLLDGDRKEDRAIVYCTNIEGGICYGGTYIIPTYERHMNKEGRYAEYVEDAESNDAWIIAKTYQIFEKRFYYWVIDKSVSLENIDCNTTNCDSIIQEHVMGPYNLAEFNDIRIQHEIDIDFE